MLSPPEYYLIKELEMRARGLGIQDFTSAEFHERLKSTGGIFSIGEHGQIRRVPPTVLLVTTDGEYAFLDRRSWSINMTRARAAARALPPHIGVQLLKSEMDDEDLREFPDGLDISVGNALVELDGTALAVSVGDAETILRELRELAEERPLVEDAPPLEKLGSFSDLLAWYRDEYLPQYDAGMLPKADERRKAIQERDAVGTYKRDRARRIMATIDDADVRKGGAPLKHKT